ncbi:MAG: Ferredoxin, 2Fe-2S [uncultured Acidimicrobiales bacterium]|uniref:Ferredoxin, 2Fe-2S n=1 Tax=uncultured Acidimicrobiales bacterium TaxID=310071 RepID=A0A6J4J696_9ACTN|nr:MAG: Ferredoxin, 2Fe-2S [uncultured Acidimicrobiales bacterium]
MKRESQSTLYRLTEQVEQETKLDPVVHGLDRLLPASMREGPVRAALGGRWLGHALHPMLTDVPIGTWTSASVLDLIGGRASRSASRRLIAVGIVAAIPTAVTGASDWTAASPTERRVGVVHAAANTVALALYIASWSARHRQRHGKGAALALTGAAVTAASGYLGGHLSLARDTALRSTSSAFDADDPTD